MNHYDDVIMDSIASQITSLTIVYSTVHSGADQSKHQSSASLAFVWEIHRWPVNFPHKWPVTRKMFPFDDVIMRGDNLTPFCKSTESHESYLFALITHHNRVQFRDSTLTGLSRRRRLFGDLLHQRLRLRNQIVLGICEYQTRTLHNVLSQLWNISK